MAKDLLITNAALFSGCEPHAEPDHALWISDGLIRFAGPMTGLPTSIARRATERQSDLTIVDAQGKFVMPGMTETHAHLSFSDASPFAIGESSVEAATITAVNNASLMLRSGFTSAVSFGSTHAIDVALRHAINSGQIEGPRLLAAGQDLGATASNVDSEGALSQIADGPWELRKAVRQQRRLGVDIVKIFIDGEAINPTNPPGELAFTDEEVAAIVDEAQRRHLRVACHARSAAAVKQAVRAGVELIGHANFLDDEAIDVLAQVKDKVFIGPAIAWEINYLAKCASLGIDRQTVIDQGYQAEIEATQRSVEKLREADIRLVVGGDYGISIAPHGTYAQDLEFFVDYFDMSPAEALRCATKNGGLAADPTGGRGTLEEGKLGDALIINGDPLANIKVLQDHQLIEVVKGGRLINPASSTSMRH